VADLFYHLLDFEYGRLLACMGDKEGARAQLDLVMSGKPLEVNSAGREGRGARPARRRRLMFFFLCRTLLARSLAQAGQVQYGGTVRMPCLMRRLSALFLLTDPVYLVISIERAAPAH